MAGMGEMQLTNRAKAVVRSAIRSGLADCSRVQRTRCSIGVVAPCTRSRADWSHVSWTTKMLSAETPVTTHSEQHAKADTGRCRSTTSTTKNISGIDSTICIIARTANRTLRKKKIIVRILQCRLTKSEYSRTWRFDAAASRTSVSPSTVGSRRRRRSRADVPGGSNAAPGGVARAVRPLPVECCRGAVAEEACAVVEPLQDARELLFLMGRAALEASACRHGVVEARAVEDERGIRKAGIGDRREDVVHHRVERTASAPEVDGADARVADPTAQARLDQEDLLHQLRPQHAATVARLVHDLERYGARRWARLR
eukprot:5909739-Prymnesium_polylepis.3